MDGIQTKQKYIYDSHHRELEFYPENLVLIYKPFRKIRKAEKLLHRWLGPYKVIRKTTMVNYEIQAQSGKGKTDRSCCANETIPRASRGNKTSGKNDN